jgi:PAS domain S-box-containing protein
MPIKYKLIALFFSVAIIPILFVSFVIFSNNKIALVDSYFSKLDIIADLKRDMIEATFDDLKDNARIAQDYYNIKKNLPIVMQYANDRAHPEYLAAKAMLDGQLHAWLKVKEEVMDLMLVNPQGKVVYVANKQHSQYDLDHILPDPEGKAFIEGKKNLYISAIYENSEIELGYKYGILVTAPIYDFDKNFIGVLAFEINMDPIYRFIQDTTGLGKTGETLLVRKEGDHVLFLNPLRHDSQAAFTRKVFFTSQAAKPAQKAVESQNGSGRSIDYRNKAVLAAWRYIPMLNCGLVAKIDQSEVLEPIIVLRNLVFIICFIALFSLSLTALATANSIAQPIEMLRRGAQIIGGGNLEHQVATDLPDEIGVLSRDFDVMRIKLKEFNEQLEQRIQEKTGELAASLQESEETKRAVLNLMDDVEKTNSELKSEIATRKVIEEKVLRLSQAVEQSSAVIVITDPKGNIEYVNPAFEKVTGYTAQEAKGQNPRILKAGDYGAAFYKNLWDTITAGKVWRGEFHNKTKSGQLIWETASISPIQDEKGNITAFVAVKEDTTQRRNKEDHLRILTKDLEHSNKELEQFAYVASHDLQEPLRMVASYTQLLERRYNDLLDEKGKQYIYYAVNGAQRMQQLISDLLMFSRVGTKGKEFKVTDMNTVYQQAVTNLEVAIQENKAQVTCDSLPIISGDEVQLIQLFQNLIGNAVKFHGSEPPQIQIHVQDREKDWLFSVSDNCIGMDEKYKDRIFIIFQRLHTKDEYQGTGIGLAVCKKIVERHEGQIWVESKVGEGATFYFMIPKERKKKLGEMLVEGGLISPEELDQTLKKQI